MSEPKRATLTSIGSQKGGENKVKEVPKTVRISLTLRESNEKACPEHNYRDLLASAEKKLRAKLLGNGEDKSNGNNKFDPFDDDNDDDVRRIAEQMEAKYGQGPIGGKKKHRRKKDDYADIGMGYDENDSFIDNTDGYDEMIPPQVTTAHGGFYINSGALEFKTDEEASSESSESEEDDEEEDERRTPDKQIASGAASRKRILQTSESEAEGEDETENNPQGLAPDAKSKPDPAEKKQKLNINGVQKVVKKKLFNKDTTADGSSDKQKTDGGPDMKKKSFTVKELLREKREDLRLPTNGEENKNQDKKTSITIDNIIESVINAARNNINQESNIKDYNNEDNINNVNPITSDSESSPESATEDGANREVVKLPENLPQQILDLINELKNLTSNGEGRFKLISSTTNKILLKLERESRCLSKLSRMKIYEHLAPFCRHKKETLQRRAKNLVFESEARKMAEPIKRLKAEVDRLMPNLLQKYEVELKKVLDKKFSKESAGPEEAAKSVRLPHKRFPWNEDTKTLLRDIVACKKRCLILKGIDKETCEPMIIEFLKKELIPLWPEGWMSYNSLWNKSTCPQGGGKTAQHQNPKHATKNTTNASISTTLVSQNQNSSCSAAAMAAFSSAISVAAAISATTTTTLLNSGTTLTPITSTAPLENGGALLHSPQSLTQPHSALTITPITTNNSSSPSLTAANIKSSLTVTPTPLVADSSIITIEDSPCKSAPATPVIVIPPKPDVASKKQPPIQIEPLPLTVMSVASNLAATASKVESQPAAIIDLTESTKKRPGPKSKTRYPAAVVAPCHVQEKEKHHHKKEHFLSASSSHHSSHSTSQQQRDGLALNLADGLSSGKIKDEPLTGTAALTQLITDSLTAGNQKMRIPKDELTSDELVTSSAGNAVIPSASGHMFGVVKQEVKNEPIAVGDTDLLQVMENLKELQKMQERKSMENLSSPVSSPVSVIAVNSSYSPTKQQLHNSSQQQVSPLQQQQQHNELPKSQAASALETGFQDMFHKHLFPDISLTRSSPNSVHNSTPTSTTVKSNYNSIDSSPYPYPRTNILSPISSYPKFMPQSTSMSNSHSSKYTNSVKNHQQKQTDLSQQDELFLFQNIMFGNGYPSASGTKHQNPSSSH